MLILTSLPLRRRDDVKCVDSKLQGLSRQVGSDWFDPPIVDIKTVGADLNSDSATSGQFPLLVTEGAGVTESLGTRVLLVLLIYGSFVLQ